MSLSSNKPEETSEMPPITVSDLLSHDKPADGAEEDGVARGKEQRTEEPQEALKENAAEKEKKLRKWQGIALDALLVLSVVAVLGIGGRYIKKQWDKYRVPTMMELTQKQCIELCAQREELQDAANRADEQLRMRRMLTHLERQLSESSAKSAQLRASISEQQNKVLALQHEIRQADKESRSVARGLLPGLPVGNISTRRGRVYANATISRVQGKRISVRTPDGAASFPVSELIRDHLPTIALYALGDVDLVDTSDFTTDGAAPPASTSTNARLRPILPTGEKPTEKDYAPAARGPVVDTDANKTSTNTSDDMPGSDAQRNDDVWHAPEGDLPL